jgi:hypothetical protein
MHSLEEELYRFVAQEILRLQDVEYCMDLIEIADPYNCLFRNIGSGSQDESRNIYRLTDLCMLDETMQWVPNRNRIRRIAESL